MKTQYLLALLAAINFPGAAFAYDIVVTPSGSIQRISSPPNETAFAYYANGQSAYAKHTELENTAIYVRSTVKIIPETGDLSRVEDVLATFDVTHLQATEYGAGCATLKVASSFLTVFAQCNASALFTVTLKTNVVYSLEVNAAAPNFGEHYSEARITVPSEVVVPHLACAGFESPMDEGAVRVKGNRALPLKATLIDADGFPVTTLASLPRLEVLFSPATSGAVDVTSDAVSVGQGTDGNQFVYSDDLWRYNLRVINFSAKGTYSARLVSPDESLYIVDPPCTGTFVIQ